MRIICKYCGSLRAMEYDTCPSCGARDWYDRSDFDSERCYRCYSAEFMEQLCSLVDPMPEDAEIILDEICCDPSLGLPKDIYLSGNIPFVGSWIRCWTSSLQVWDKPTVRWFKPDIWRDSMITINARTAKSLHNAYKHMSANLFKQICAYLLVEDIEVNSIYVYRPTTYDARLPYGQCLKLPSHIYVDGYTKRIASIITKAIESVCSMDYHVPLGSFKVEDAASYLNFGLEYETTKFTWEELIMAASLNCVDVLSKYTTRFVPDAVYDYTGIVKDKHGVFVKHKGTSHWLVLPEGCELEELMGERSDEFDMKKIEIVPDTSLMCVGTRPLKFIASYEMKQPSSVSMLLEAASKMLS